MPLKRVGFFFEETEADQVSQLKMLRREKASASEPEIIQYLTSGTDCGVAMTIEHDLLSDPPKAIGEALLKTDGVWTWPLSLAYYVENYHIKLPDEFIERMSALDWIAPTDVDIDEIQFPDGHTEM